MDHFQVFLTFLYMRAKEDDKDNMLTTTSGRFHSGNWNAAWRPSVSPTVGSATQLLGPNWILSQPAVFEMFTVIEQVVTPWVSGGCSDLCSWLGGGRRSMKLYVSFTRPMIRSPWKWFSESIIVKNPWRRQRRWRWWAPAKRNSESPVAPPVAAGRKCSNY